MVVPFPTRGRGRALAAVVAAALALVACENNAPAPGEACTAGGGACKAEACADVLPQYDCGSGQYCCRASSADGGPGR